MGGFLNTIVTSLELGRVRRSNASAKGIGNAGKVNAENLLACSDNALIATRDDSSLASVIAGRCASYVSCDWPVVLLHEGNDALVAEVRAQIGTSGGRVVEADGRRCFYDPLLGLSSRDAASLLYRAAESVRTVPDDMLTYLRVLTRILEARNYATYVRMVDGCPHARIHEVIARAEANGALSVAEAASLRSDVDSSSAGRAAAQGFLGDVVREGVVLPDASGIGKAVSVASFVQTFGPGVLSVDLGTCSGQSLISIILTEIEDFVRRGCGVQVILSVDSVWSRMGEKLAHSSSDLGWTIAVHDVAHSFAKPEELMRLAAGCKRVAIFSQGLQASEMASALFGEYDKQDATVTTGGYGMRNAFGNGSVSVTTRRERVVQPEEIRELRAGEFFLSDSADGLFKGRIV